MRMEDYSKEEYKQKIIEMVSEVTSDYKMRYIYYVIKKYLKK